MLTYLVLAAGAGLFGLVVGYYYGNREFNDQFLRVQKDLKFWQDIAIRQKHQINGPIPDVIWNEGPPPLGQTNLQSGIPARPSHAPANGPASRPSHSPSKPGAL
jgi:hypothetical protein